MKISSPILKLFSYSEADMGNRYEEANRHIVYRDSSVGIATELQAGRSADRIPIGARFSAPVQNGPGAHPASCTIGIVSFPGVKCGRGVTLTPHPLLVPWPIKSRAIPLLPLWAVRPVQSLSTCTGGPLLTLDRPQVTL